MQISYILNNLHLFKQCDTNSEWASPLPTVLDTLYEGMLQVYDPYLLARLADKSRFEIYQIFDVPHGSDEACVLYLALHEKKPLALVYKFADKSDWEYDILDAENYKVLARDLMMKVFDERMQEDVGTQQVKKLSDLKNNYISFLGSQATCFAVLSPKWALGFLHLMHEHPAYYPTDGGRMVKIDKIVEFENNLQSWDGPEAQEVIVDMEGQMQVVDGCRIIFELAAGQGDLDDVMASLPKEARWAIDKDLSGPLDDTNVYIRQEMPFSWYSFLFILKPSSKQSRKALVEQYGSEESYPGVFSPQALGIDGEFRRVS